MNPALHTPLERSRRDARGSDKLIIKTNRGPSWQLKVMWPPCGEETDDKVEEGLWGHALFFLPLCLGKPGPVMLLLERDKLLLAGESEELCREGLGRQHSSSPLCSTEGR